MSTLGLRFAVLGDPNEPTKVEEAVEGKGTQMDTAAMEALSYGMNAGLRGQTEQTLDSTIRQKDDITLSVSHENLTHILRPLTNKGVVDWIRVVGPKGETKKTKEKPLKEITTKLVAQPFNLKPSWTGLKQSLEKSKGNVEEKLNLFAHGGLELGPKIFTLQPGPIAVSTSSTGFGQAVPTRPGTTCA